MESEGGTRINGDVGVTPESPDPAASSAGLPWGAILYAGLAGLFLTFFLVFTAATQIEIHGPSEAATGRVLERERGERTVTSDLNPEGVSRRLTVTYPAYTVIGERDDGTSWLVVGEEPYRFAGGIMGEDITVRTSTITGRVVGLEAGARSWETSDSSLWMVGPAGLLFVVGLLGIYEAARRRGRFAAGLTRGVWLGAGLPGVAVGAVGAIWVLFGNTWGLEVVTTADRLDGFAQRPAEVEWSRVDGREFAVIGRDNLAEDWAADHDEVARSAVVVAVVGQRPMARTRYDYLLVSDGAEIASIRCPPGFGSEWNGPDDLRGRLVCFPPGSPAEEIAVRVTFGDLPPKGTWTIPIP